MLKPSSPKRLSDLVPQALGPAAARQGFASAEILARWEAIVGPELARVSRPQKLAAPPRGPEDPEAPAARSTLTVRVEGAFALELQHRAPEIVERVNAHLGWACVGGVKIRQGPVAGLSSARTRTAKDAEPVSAADEARLSSATAGVEDEGLTEALGRLGRAVLGARRG
jgi:hypothetical protein